MKKSRIALSIVAVCLVAATTIGGTLAWFTDNASKQNNMSMAGDFDVDIEEPNYKEDDYQDLVPGDNIWKDPTISMSADSADAYIRVPISSLGVQVTKKDQTVENWTLEQFKAAVATTWTQVGEYFYYGTGDTAETMIIVKGGDKIPLLATTVDGDKTYTMTIPAKEFNSTYAGAAIQITFKVEAVQAKNFTSDIWNDVQTNPAVN